MKYPWEELPWMWKTKAKYFEWLRGQIRRAWNRHPIKIAYKKSKTFHAPKGKLIDKRTKLPKLVKCQVCEYCGETYRDGETQVDHIEGAGSFRNWDECQDWMMRMMQVNFDGLQILCKYCHDHKSYAEKNNCSFEEAQARKSYIAWNKETDTVTQIDLLEGEGYDDVSNAKKRRIAYLDLYRKSD